MENLNEKSLVYGVIKFYYRKSNYIYNITCPQVSKDKYVEMYKEDILQEIHENNLDECKGHEWSTNEYYKLKQKIENIAVIWK